MKPSIAKEPSMLRQKEMVAGHYRRLGTAGERGQKVAYTFVPGNLTELMLAFDLDTPELRDRALERMLANGLLLLPCGVRSIRFRPPLNLTAAEADTALDLVRKSLKEL